MTTVVKWFPSDRHRVLVLFHCRHCSAPFHSRIESPCILYLFSARGRHNLQEPKLIRKEEAVSRISKQKGQSKDKNRAISIIATFLYNLIALLGLTDSLRLPTDVHLPEIVIFKSAGLAALLTWRRHLCCGPLKRFLDSCTKFPRFRVSRVWL